mmetsp:Transcript_13227/g.23761  ORF Transcript_13227/g.23761 Transcript_13227/m.23761 type:complete len:182 (-) Transcript_13227:1624-2169(-)
MGVFEFLAVAIILILLVFGIVLLFVKIPDPTHSKINVHTFSSDGGVHRNLQFEDTSIIEATEQALSRLQTNESNRNDSKPMSRAPSVRLNRSHSILKRTGSLFRGASNAAMVPDITVGASSAVYHGAMDSAGTVLTGFDTVRRSENPMLQAAQDTHILPSSEHIMRTVSQTRRTHRARGKH